MDHNAQNLRIGPSEFPSKEISRLSKAADKAAELMRNGRPFQSAVSYAAGLSSVPFQDIAKELSRRGRARRAKKAA